MPGAKKPKKKVRETRTPVEGVPWYKAPQILVATTGIAGGFVAVCHAFHIPMPFTQAEVAEGLAGGAAIGSGVYFIYRRIKTGLDPRNPTPRLTK